MFLSRQTFGNMAGLKFGQAYSLPDGKFSQHAWHTCWQCGGGTLEGDLVLRKPMAKNDMDLLSMLLPHRQRNFAGHPDKCPAEALPRNKALWKAECSDHPAAIMAIQAKSAAFRVALHHGGRPSPHQETEAWPQLRTRTSVFLYLRKHSFREILPPDALRSWSQAVVRSAEGEVISLPCCLLRTLCDCQMSGLPALAFPLSLI